MNEHDPILDTLAWLLAGESQADVRAQPEYQAAQAQLEVDAALRARFDNELVFAERYDSLVATASLPADARERILQTLTQAAGAEKRVAWPRHPALAWAAALVLLLGAAWFALDRVGPGGGATPTALASFPASMDGFRDFSAHIVDGRIALQHLNPDYSELRGWLETKGIEEFSAPEFFTKGDTIGCQILDWDGRQVSLICLNTGSGVVHLFVTKTEGIQDSENCSAVDQTLGCGRSCRAWVADRRAFVLITDQPQQELPTPST